MSGVFFVIAWLVVAMLIIGGIRAHIRKALAYRRALKKQGRAFTLKSVFETLMIAPSPVIPNLQKADCSQTQDEIKTIEECHQTQAIYLAALFILGPVLVCIILLLNGVMGWKLLG